jgi:hypothetical protein
MYQLSCINCRGEFAAKRWDAKYCSASCNAEYWRNQRDAKNRRAEELLRKFTEAIGSGADATVFQALSREARMLFANRAKR